MRSQASTGPVTRIATLVPLGLCGATLLFGIAQPANAGQRDLTRTEWVNRVTDSLNANLRTVEAVSTAVRHDAAAVVAVSFDADGEYRNVTMAQPTGNRMLDREAIRAVSKISYPQLPQSLRGKPRTVAMEVFFGKPEQHPHRIEIRETAGKVAREQGISGLASLNN